MFLPLRLFFCLCTCLCISVCHSRRQSDFRAPTSFNQLRVPHSSSAWVGNNEPNPYFANSPNLPCPILSLSFWRQGGKQRTPRVFARVFVLAFLACHSRKKSAIAFAHPPLTNCHLERSRSCFCDLRSRKIRGCSCLCICSFAYAPAYVFLSVTPAGSPLFGRPHHSTKTGGAPS